MERGRAVMALVNRKKYEQIDKKREIGNKRK